MSPSPSSSSSNTMMYAACTSNRHHRHHHHSSSLLHPPMQQEMDSSPQFLRQACSSPSDHSWTSDWSDPRENCNNNSGNGNAGTAANSASINVETEAEQEEAGILVPALLRQLFGVDFLPSPAAAGAASSITTSQQRHAELNGQDCDSSLASPITPPELKLNGLEEKRENGLLCKEHRDPLFNGKSESVMDASFMEEQKTLRRQKNKRLVAAIRKACFNNNHTKRTNAAGTQQQHTIRPHPKSVSRTAATTPRRKGSCTPRSLRESLIDQGGATCMTSTDDGTTIRWVQEQMAIMQQQQLHLARVNDESHQVQERALSIQKNISSIQSEVSSLQQALQSCLSDLQQQVTDLNATKQRLGCLEKEASRASDNVEQVVKALRKASRGGSKMRLFRQNNNNNPQLRHRFFTADSFPTIETITTTFSVAESTNIDENAVAIKDSSFVPATEKDGSTCNNLSHCNAATRTTISPPLQYNRRRASTEPPRHSSSSFMRVNDLELDKSSVSSTHSSLQDSPVAPDTDSDFFFIDHDIPLVMEQLFKLGYDVVTDESGRFEPTRETRRMLQQRKQTTTTTTMQPIADWPIYPWHAVDDTDDVYVWTGGVPHRGFGHDWPVVKARTLIRASPRAVLDVLLDSSQIKKYNKMSQGREDVLILQEGVETTSEESQYGFAGDARIMRALNKPRLFPKTIEVLSLWYSQQLENAPGSYMTVSRSVWEDELGHDSKASSGNNMLRSEMLLGVTLLRPCPYGCEITTITHVFSPGVPEVMAKRSTPGSAANLLRDIQSLFPKKKE